MKPKRLSCHSSDATSTTATTARVKAGRRVHGPRTSPTKGASTSMSSASGLAASAARRWPVPSRAIAVVPPQKGQGTPVDSRSRQKVDGRWRKCTAPSASTTPTSTTDRRATTTGRRRAAVSDVKRTAERACRRSPTASPHRCHAVSSRQTLSEPHTGS